MLQGLLEWDQALFLQLNSFGSSFWDPFFLLLSHKATNVVFYLSLLLYIGYKRNTQQAVILFFLAVLLVVITDQITNAFKYGFERLRPCYTEGIKEKMRWVKEGCGGRYSFFSGHASNSFALATFFGFIFSKYKRLLPLMFGLAAAVAYSRIYLGVHFPLDILCGSLFGILWTSLYFSVLYSLAKKKGYTAIFQL